MSQASHQVLSLACRQPRHLLVLLLGLALAGPAACRKKEATVDRDLEPAAARLDGTGLNVLLISVDTTRADHLGCYGHPTVKTPHIDRFATEGTRFAWCISSAPLTLPSHATMLTGSYPFVHGARDNGTFHLTEENVTLAEVFRQAGYDTYGEVSAAVLNHRYGLNQGFDTYGDTDSWRKDVRGSLDALAAAPDLNPDELMDSLVDREKLDFNYELRAADITDRAVHLLEARTGTSRPFFMFLHYFDPHWPFEAPEPFSSQYADGYYAEIAYFDAQFGRLLENLQRLGLTDRTLVVLTSDHGEGRGQHGEATHSAFLYDTTLHVPLIIRLPGLIPAGQVVEAQVRLIDIASTLVDFARLESTGQMQGTTLLPVVQEPGLKPGLACYADTMVPKHSHDYSPLRSLRTDDWKFILAPRDELYQVSQDRLELANLAAVERDRAAAMRRELRELIARSPPPPGSRSAWQTVDSAELERLQALGYIGSSLDVVETMSEGTELDHFEPVGAHPRDHIEEIECLAHGMGAVRLERFEDGEQFLRRLIQLDPSHPQARAYLALAVAGQGRDDEAIELYQQAIEDWPENDEAHGGLGIMLARKGQTAEAEKCFRRALELDPDEFDSLESLGRVVAAQGRHEEALQHYEAAIEVSPGLPSARAHLAASLVALGREEEAIVALKQAIHLDPEFIPAHVRLAHIQRRTDRVEDAIHHLDRAIARLPDRAVLHHALGQARASAGDRKAAAREFERAVELQPEGPVMRQSLAVNWIALGQPEEAVPHLREAVKLAPDSAWALFRLATALSQLKQNGEAVELCQQALETAPRLVPARLLAADLLDALEKASDAVALLRAGRDLLPNQIELANDLAWRLATSRHDNIRDGVEAVRLAEWANAQRESDDPGVLDTLAAAYAEAGQFDKAVDAARRARDLARQANRLELAERIAARLSRYESSQPYHES